MKVLAFYIQVENQGRHEELKNLLAHAIFDFLETTSTDSYTSGPCALGSLKEIREDLFPELSLRQINNFMY